MPEEKRLSAHTVIDGKPTDKPVHDLSKKDDALWREIVLSVLGKDRLDKSKKIMNKRREI